VYAAALALPVDASTVMRVLMGLRTLPARLAGRKTRVAARSLTEAMQQSGFALLGERPGEEIVLGLAGKFWQLSPERAALRGREDFLSYQQNGSARASMNLRIAPLADGRTRLSTETRVRCFGGAAQKFKLYWMLVGPFSAWIRRDWLRSIKRASESARP
jgi:hypothetical protein